MGSGAGEAGHHRDDRVLLLRDPRTHAGPRDIGPLPNGGRRQGSAARGGRAWLHRRCTTAAGQRRGRRPARLARRVDCDALRGCPPANRGCRAGEDLSATPTCFSLLPAPSRFSQLLLASCFLLLPSPFSLLPSPFSLLVSVLSVFSVFSDALFPLLPATTSAAARWWI